MLLLQEYFSPAVAEEEVWIQTSRAELDSFAFHLGGATGLIEVVKLGPSVEMVLDLAEQRRQEYRRNEDYPDPGGSSGTYRLLNAPTYLPHVAVWVLAASEQGSDGFYGSVSRMLGVVFDGSVARGALARLWEDLEYWSITELDGKLGKFTARPLGAHKYVGLAKAQALLTSGDRDGLSRLFKQQGLAPGQGLSSRRFLELARFATESYFLSKTLREALSNVTTYGPVLEEIFQSRLSEWDGRVPSVGSTSVTGRRFSRDESRDEEVADELSLILRPAFETDWEVGWRFQSSVEVDQYELKIGKGIFSGYADMATGYVTCIGSDKKQQDLARRVLEVQSEEPTLAKVSYTRSGDVNGAVNRSYTFPQKSTRVLTWDNRNELVERELPLAGSAYVLTSEANTVKYFDTHRISFQKVPDNDGVPDGWLLLSLLNVNKLTSVQRQAIYSFVGDQTGGSVKARIKFISGCPILRGGAKQYADYDLPLVEMDAPVGTAVTADGLRFEEIVEASEGSRNSQEVNIRKFVIQREDLSLIHI